MIANIPSAAIVFLGCITGILVLMILFLLYVKQVGICKYLPTPLCFAERPKAVQMDDSDEEIFDKFECLMDICPDKDDKPIVPELLGQSRKNAVNIDSPDSALVTQCRIQLGITYLPTTGTLTIEAIKGNDLQTNESEQGCYLKFVVCTDSGYQLSHTNSKVVTGLHPDFNETFYFNILQFQIKSVTVMMSVYFKKSFLQKEMIGWIAIGSYNSSDVQLSHWNDVMSNYGKQSVKWHSLMEPEYLNQND